MTVNVLPKRYPEMAGKVALVTGGSSGIGFATAQAFAREGATVIIASRNEKRGKQALSSLVVMAAGTGLSAMSPTVER